MASVRSSNITWHGSEISDQQRRELAGQPGCVVWFTGLSASGKSTVARRVEAMLADSGHPVYALDGDNLRMGLNEDLGFAPQDRVENIRRVGAVAALFADAGLICLAAFISPYAAGRAQARARVPEGRFIEVFVDTPLAECEARDPKGLYAKARAGEIPSFTGISAPYEAPERPEIRVDTTQHDLESCARLVFDELQGRGMLHA